MGNIYHEWDGTTLIITSDSGTSACDLKGAKGDIGVRGPQGVSGEAGKDGTLTFVDFTDEQRESLKGDKGDKGDTGADGVDGISATHSWDGTVLTITSASGTSSADLKVEYGEKGDKGDPREVVGATKFYKHTISFEVGNSMNGSYIYEDVNIVYYSLNTNTSNVFEYDGSYVYVKKIDEIISTPRITVKSDLHRIFKELSSDYKMLSSSFEPVYYDILANTLGISSGTVLDITNVQHNYIGV